MIANTIYGFTERVRGIITVSPVAMSGDLTKLVYYFGASPVRSTFVYRIEESGFFYERWNQ